MSDEGFLRRWARLKAEPPAAPPAVEPPVARPPANVAPAPRASQAPGDEALAAPVLPTLDDVARLDANSDFSVFVAKGVDKDVRRLAMKKLFADPHFNLIDRLDVYMDDYNKASPVSEAMLAALHHTKNLFAPLAGAANEADDATGQDATAGIGEGAVVALGDEAGHASPGSDAVPAQPEQMQQIHAAAGGVPQHTQQGKA